MTVPVSAQTPNDLMVVFSDTVSAGFAALQASVNGIFGLMIVLVVALTGLQWVLSPHREVLAAGFGKVLLIGAFAWLINDWQALSETIYAGFLTLGLTAGGGSLTAAEFLNPGAILAQGWQIVKALGESPAPVDNPLDIAGNLTDALVLGLAMIGILLAFALLALQIIVSLIEFKIVTLGGFVLLPFGIWSKTAFLAERPLGYVVSSGLKVLALAIVVSGARTIFDQLQPSTNPDIYEALSLLVAAILLAMLALFIPNLASALVTGGPSLGAGAMLTGALAVGGSGALAGAGLVRAGVMGSGGGAARMAAPARAAAGSGGGRSPTPPSGPSAPPRPSNDNPAPAASSLGRAGGMNAPAVAWPVGPAAGSGGTLPPDRWAAGSGPAQSSEVIAAETRAARAAFHRAAAGTAPGSGPPRGRSAALQAFFVANAGRGLLPSGETSGSLSPSLRPEEP